MKIRALPAFALLIAATQPAVAAPTTEIHYTMGTYFSITIDGLAEKEARGLMRQCFHEARRLEDVFSRYDPTSELSRLNARRDNSPIEVSPELANLLAKSLRLNAATSGTFDVTIGALTTLSADDQSNPTFPLSRWREPVHGAKRTNDEQHGSWRARFVAKRRIVVAPGVQLDFDGIAKGYTVDRCVSLLSRSGVRRALLSLGESSQYALGAPIGFRAWTVAVRDLSGNRALGTLALRDQALSVSSVFTRERRVAHIVDPRNGKPLDEPSIAIVVADSATEAEAWSKALLIGGFQPEDLPPALLITRHNVERLGTIPFSAYDSPRVIEANAEPFL